MRFILFIVIGLLVGGLIYTFFITEQQKIHENSMEMQQEAQEKADAYNKQQAEMMKKLEQ
jgi:uncharacterized membrane protein (DUF106 family)